jgi:hypothetical protein
MRQEDLEFKAILATYGVSGQPELPSETLLKKPTKHKQKTFLWY